MATTMQTILTKYRGPYIGVTLDKPGDMRAAKVVGVGNDYFTVHAPSRGIYCFPFQRIPSMAEAESGRSFDIDRTPVQLAVAVYHQIIYSGAVGISVPIGVSHAKVNASGG